MVLVPWERLAPETLTALIEEFVTRDGAEHGHEEVPLERKVEQVRQMLRSGKAVISYEEGDGTVTVVLSEALGGGGPGARGDGGRPGA